MEETVRLEMTKAEAEQFQALLERFAQEVREADQRMDQMEAERLQLQAETRVLLQQIKELLHVENHY